MVAYVGSSDQREYIRTLFTELHSQRFWFCSGLKYSLSGIWLGNLYFIGVSPGDYEAQVNLGHTG